MAAWQRCLVRQFDASTVRGKVLLICVGFFGPLLAFYLVGLFFTGFFALFDALGVPVLAYKRFLKYQASGALVALLIVLVLCLVLIRLARLWNPKRLVRGRA